MREKLQTKHALAAAFTRTGPEGNHQFLVAKYAPDHPTYAHHLGFPAIAKKGQESDDEALARLGKDQLGTDKVQIVSRIGAASKRKEHHILELTLVEAAFTEEALSATLPDPGSSKYTSFHWEDDPIKLNDVIKDGSVCGLIYQSNRKK